MRRAITFLSIVVVTFIVFILWYRWDSGTNHGYTWGYWGQFNTISNSLAKLPGVTIVKCGWNADVTMEEFEFDIVTANGRQIKVQFDGDAPIRKLSGNALSEALLETINEPSTNKPDAVKP